MPRGKRCIVHVHEYVTSEEHHHLQPQSRGGKTKADNMVWLCANAHGDVHFFLDLIEDAATRLMVQFRSRTRDPEAAVKAVPGSIAKHYSPAVRRTAVRGWMRYGADFLAGTYDAHALLWSSSGQPRENLVYRMPYAIAAEWNEAEHMLGRARMHLDGRADLAGPM
jgi:hypothetical protein